MIEQLLTALYTKLISFVQYIFNAIFGDWNYSVLFTWLPADILAAVTFIILFLFGLKLISVVKDLLPF